MCRKRITTHSPPARRHQAVRGDGQVWESYTCMQARTHVGRQRHCHRHMAGPCIRRPLTVCSREDSRELGSLFGVRNAARADARIIVLGTICTTTCIRHTVAGFLEGERSLTDKQQARIKCNGAGSGIGTGSSVASKASSG